jgi:hypothetical protein
MLDEPAVALHPSLQRQLGAHLLSAPAQFLVITHSAELLPLADAADVKLVRLDRALPTRPRDSAIAIAFVNSAFASADERTGADAIRPTSNSRYILNLDLRFGIHVLITIGKEEL